MPEFAERWVSYLERESLASFDWASSPMWLACALTARAAGARILMTGETGDFALGVACEPTLRALREGSPWDAVTLPLMVAKAYGWRRRDMLPSIAQQAGQYLQQDVLRPLSPALYWTRRRRRHQRMRQMEHPAHVRPLPGALQPEMMERFSRLRAHVEWPFEGREDHLLAHGADRNMLGGMGDMWNRVGSAAGIEARHPILDRELVEFCMAVPWRERMAGGLSKSLLRRSGILPAGHARQRIMDNANSPSRHAMCAALGGWLGNRLESLLEAEHWFTSDYLRDLRGRWGAGDREGSTLDQVLEVVSIEVALGRRPS
jgi:asparagine synthetase B (glutamine-hydrolysing)